MKLILTLAAMLGFYSLTAQEVVEQEEELIFKIVETMPEYPGGEEALTAYLSKLKVPESTMKGEEDNLKVYIQFVVETNGSIGHVMVVRSSGNADLDQAATQHIQAMPNWTPGYQRHKPVAVKMVIPFLVRL